MKNTLNPIKAILVLSILAIFVGCSGIQKEFVRQNLFRINAIPVESDLIKHKEKTALLVRQFDISPEFESDHFVYRVSSSGYTQDYYNRFMVAPSRMISDAVKEELYASFYFAPADEPSGVKYLLKGKVIELYADIRNKENPRAVMTLRLILEKHTDQGFIPVISKTYPEAIALDQISPDSLVKAWDQCLGSILSDFYKAFNLFLPGALDK